VVAVDTSSWSFIHTWAEDYYGGNWVHVDPPIKCGITRQGTWAGLGVKTLGEKSESMLLKTAHSKT